MSVRNMLLCLCALPLQPGASTRSAEPEALKKLERWVGAWKGTGWASRGGTERIEFQLSELVQSKVGGSVLLVEGRGTSRNDTGEEVVTHDGLALVYYDKKSGQYRWNGHDLGWGTVDVEATLIDGGLTWRFSPDGGHALVRFTLTFDEEHWHEVGDFSSDGTSWKPMMEMTLLRDRTGAR